MLVCVYQFWINATHVHDIDVKGYKRETIEIDLGRTIIAMVLIIANNTAKTLKDKSWWCFLDCAIGYLLVRIQFLIRDTKE